MRDVIRNVGLSFRPCIFKILSPEFSLTRLRRGWVSSIHYASAWRSKAHQGLQGNNSTMANAESALSISAEPGILTQITVAWSGRITKDTVGVSSTEALIEEVTTFISHVLPLMLCYFVMVVLAM
ncbi:hypothetical protein OG21DRAFT_1324062 [Imleria badia]|nr:hypothetical protein OG21DRAFT_1324062 [Imleria badia]